MLSSQTQFKSHFIFPAHPRIDLSQKKILTARNKKARNKKAGLAGRCILAPSPELKWEGDAGDDGDPW